MSKYEKEAEKYASKNFQNKSSFEYHNQYTSFIAGAEFAKEEYEEKLRWISPNIKPQLLDENSIFSENVSIRVENGEYEYSGYYNFQTRQWLIYPNEEPFEFQLIAGWRYFL